MNTSVLSLGTRQDTLQLLTLYVNHPAPTAIDCYFLPLAFVHNEELKGLYSSPNIVRVIKYRRIRWAGHVARMGEGKGVYRVLVGKPEGKRPLGRPRHRWEDNIRMDL